MLLTDTNILARCSRGRAIFRVLELYERGVALATTDRNVEELRRKLVSVFDLSSAEARSESERVLDLFHLVPDDVYEDMRGDADQRLRAGGKADWPLLAAALALDGEIWSDDLDFFGVGVPVWSTNNVLLAQTSDER